ncbi:MAG: LapA family protein [Gammaproteobacteria bacterium]
MSRVLYLTFAILVALAGLAFHVRNRQEITLDYFAGALDVELSWLVVASLVLGVILGVLGMTSSLLRLKREVRRLSRQHELASRELSSLRAVALKDGR